MINKNDEQMKTRMKNKINKLFNSVIFFFLCLLLSWYLN